MSFVAVRPCCRISWPQTPDSSSEWLPALEQDASPAEIASFSRESADQPFASLAGGDLCGQRHRPRGLPLGGSLKMPKTFVGSMLVFNPADFCGPAPVWSCLCGARASESAQNVRPEGPRTSGGRLAEYRPLRPRVWGVGFGRSGVHMNVKQVTRLVAGLVCSLVFAACSNSEEAKKEHFENANRFVAAGQAAGSDRRVPQRSARKTRSSERPASSSPRPTSAVGTPTRRFASTCAPQTSCRRTTTHKSRRRSYLVGAGNSRTRKTRIQPVIDRDPTNVEAQLILGNALVGLKDLDGAVREIEEAIKLEPSVA